MHNIALFHGACKRFPSVLAIWSDLLAVEGRDALAIPTRRSVFGERVVVMRCLDPA